MINQSALTSALYDLIAADPSIVASVAVVERSERINFDPGRCPWIGVYPGNVTSEPLTIGLSGTSWRTRGALQVVIQTSSYTDDGREASDTLEFIATVISDIITDNPTIGQTGFRVISYSREYQYTVFDSDGIGTVFMPQMVIKINFEMRG